MDQDGCTQQLSEENSHLFTTEYPGVDIYLLEYSPNKIIHLYSTCITVSKIRRHKFDESTYPSTLLT